MEAKYHYVSHEDAERSESFCRFDTPPLFPGRCLQGDAIVTSNRM